MLNQGQMDRWNIVTTLNYLPEDVEISIVESKVPAFQNDDGHAMIQAMVRLAGMTRSAFLNGDLSIVMSPRTVISWAENVEIFGDIEMAFKMSFLNKCEESEREMVREFYQRCFGDTRTAEEWT